MGITGTLSSFGTDKGAAWLEETRRQNKSVHLEKINMRRKGQSVEQSRNMLAAQLGSDPCQHWEQTTVYTQHAISTLKPPLETARREDVSPQKKHEGPQAFPATSDIFMCHWLPPHCHHHLVLNLYHWGNALLRGVERGLTAKDSNGKQPQRQNYLKKADYKINEQINE